MVKYVSGGAVSYPNRYYWAEREELTTVIGSFAYAARIDWISEHDGPDPVMIALSIPLWNTEEEAIEAAERAAAMANENHALPNLGKRW